MSESTKPPIALGLEVLQAAVAGNVAAIRAEIPLEPAGGWQDKVFPPTYSGGVYATEKRLLDGKEVETVVLDSVQSQANRVEEALLCAFDEGRINLPVMEMTVPDYGRVTSLDASIVSLTLPFATRSLTEFRFIKALTVSDFSRLVCVTPQPSSSFAQRRSCSATGIPTRAPLRTGLFDGSLARVNAVKAGFDRLVAKVRLTYF